MSNTSNPHLRSLAIDNFKAIRHSGVVRLKALTVFIGNNGSGKSSLIEAARAYQRLILEGVDEAFADVLGFEHIRNQSALPSRAQDDPKAMRFKVTAELGGVLGNFKAELAINSSREGNTVFIETETVENANSLYFDRNNTDASDTLETYARNNPGKSVVREWLGAAPWVHFVERWQFVLLNPDVMGKPKAKRRTGGRLALAHDGSNLAEYLLDLAERSPTAFNEVVEAMSYVLPYAAEVQTKLADDLERRVYLELVERSGSKNWRVPGWLFSTGTLRVLAIIALLKDPDPPPVIFIEEIENGLDPRTVGLVVDLVREATASGRTQVIATSHSPYLLDLLELEDLVLCQRDASGEPKFRRADSDKALQAWREDFTPGKLYAMGRLQQMGHEVAAPGSEAPPQAPRGGWEDAEGDV
jgi:predicted ATPase